MKFAVIGLNHNTAPAEIREKASFTDSGKIELASSLLDFGIDEAVILSTCNRSEIYITAPEKKFEASVEKVRDLYSRLLDREDSGRFLYAKEDDEAISHVYKVAAGLDSIIVGEDQILGQVKDALSFAMNIGSSRKVMDKLFREAVTTAKKIKAELKISQIPLSVSSIGVRFIKEKLGDYKDKNIFIIGLGKVGRLALNYILEEDTGKIYMANRNHSKAADLSKDYPKVIPVDYKDRYHLLEDADVLITATSFPHVIIRAEEMKPRKKELYIMDMAIPRDVDENVGKLRGIHLYNVDDLKNLSEHNERMREELSEQAGVFIEAGVAEFKAWLSSMYADPVIKSLKEKCDIIEADTLEYLDRKLELDGRDRRILEKVLGSALKRLIREPVLKLKEIEDDSKRKLYISVIEELFDIDFE